MVDSPDRQARVHHIIYILLRPKKKKHVHMTHTPGEVLSMSRVRTEFYDHLLGPKV